MNICFKKKYVEKQLLYYFLTEKAPKCRDKPKPSILYTFLCN